MTDRYYIEYDEVDKHWCVVKEDANHENFHLFDEVLCFGCTESEAELICKVLNYYQENSK